MHTIMILLTYHSFIICQNSYDLLITNTAIITTYQNLNRLIVMLIFIICNYEFDGIKYYA